MGDTTQGSSGLRAQTYIESEFEFFVVVDPTNSTDPRPIEQRLTLPVVADEIAQIVCILPSQAVLGEPVEIFVKGEDRWRNPTPAPDSLAIKWVGGGEVEIVDGKLLGRKAGTGFLHLTAGDFTCRSNPIELVAEAPQRKRFWGDLHAQTAATVGVGSEDEYFAFGRDLARLDFTSHQGNDFQITDEYWQHLNETTAKFHEDGKFVVFPGYEWSGSSPTGGDHNVIYREENRPILRSSHWLVPHIPANELSPAHPADQFYAKLKQAVPVDEVLVCQHVGGRYANLRKHFDQELISLVELVSVWGVFEWMLWDAFDKGYIVGVMGNSDGHHGRPGAEGAGMSEFGIENGLTCVLAESLTRNVIFDALKSRRCYATTGARLLLNFTINGAPMGTLLLVQAGQPLTIEAAITGDAPIESLQLFCGREMIAEQRPPEFDSLTQSNQIRVVWQGSRERGRQRRVTWDGAVRVEGCEIISAETHSFDVIADGITSQSATTVTFTSKTTGDRDGLDLMLNDANHGTLIFDSAVGQTSINLADLSDDNPRQIVSYGGVDMQLTVERYPVAVETLSLQLSQVIAPHANKRTPYFVKVTQTDGSMAWASPIYVEA